MSLRQEIPVIKTFIQNQQSFIDHNKVLFQILEGDLLTFVLQDLEKQLSARSFQVAKHRVAPINVLKKLIDKLSKIYMTSPTRIVTNNNKTDQELVDWWVKKAKWNQKMNTADENFNAYKNKWVEPKLVRGKPK